jgi:hypothetical protein
VSPARDLSGDLGTVRDQGPRGTCLAFAATAVHEQARRTQRGAWTDALGEEILYWTCKQTDGNRKCGTHPQSVADALRSPGQSAAGLWPYTPHRDETAADYSPPAAAQAADQMHHASVRGISQRLDELRRRIDSGHGRSI